MITALALVLLVVLAKYGPPDDGISVLGTATSVAAFLSFLVLCAGLVKHVVFPLLTWFARDGGMQLIGEWL